MNGNKLPFQYNGNTSGSGPLIGSPILSKGTKLFIKKINKKIKQVAVLPNLRLWRNQLWMTELYVPKKQCFAEARSEIQWNHRFYQNFIYGTIFKHK